MNKLALLLLLMSSVAWADGDQIITDVGLGQFGSRGSSLSQDKFAKVGIQEEIWGPFQQRFNLGGWLDTRGPGYSSAAFTGYQVGYEVSNSIFQASVWTGPTIISATDQVLGGYFQLNETIFFGIVDRDRDAIGMVYNHLSSGPLATPNLGRDYLGLEIKVPFY